MTDERTVLVESIDSVIRAVPEDSPHARSWKAFAEEFPDAVYTSYLPVESKLNGSVKGGLVLFDKEYLGPQEGVWSATGLEPSVEKQDTQPLVYEGRLSADAKEIRGTWSILEVRLGGLWKRPIESGEFWLTRVLR